MKILFAIKALHQASGGAERVATELANALAGRGHSISLLTFDAPGKEPFYPLVPEVGQLQLGIGNPLTSTSPIVFCQQVIALRRSVLARRPDVVVAFMNSMFTPMAFALIGSKVPLVASEHIVRQHYRRRPVQLALFVASVPLIERFTMLSEVIGREYWPAVRRKMTSIPNPLPASFCNDWAEGESEDPCRILSVGRFVAQKDHQTLIDAFARIAEEFPGWSLRILGDGELRPKLLHRVRKLGLEDRISLPGVARDVAGEMSDASFFALASRYESFGMVIAEAMACRRAAVAFADCHGVNQLIDHERTGLLVSGCDRVSAMADGLRRLILDPAGRRQMGVRAREYVLRRYSLPHICDLWEQLLINTVKSYSN